MTKGNPDMTTDPRPWDVRELAAGDARRADTPAPDDADRLQPLRRPTLIPGWEAALHPARPTGDLDAAAAETGVDVAELVRLRRELGITSHRAPSLWTRLFRKG
jgi:hypothetical protein